MDELRTRFLKAYSNIPLSLRDDVILLLDQRLKATGTVVKDSLTWRVAYVEVMGNSAMSETILNELATLDLI